MNKSLSKAIMVKAKIRNIFFKSKREENNINYNKQRNLDVNKKIWKVVKPLLSIKIMCSEKIALVEGTKIFKNDKETAKVLNNFFSTIIQNLKSPQYIEQDPISVSIKDSEMREIVKYRAHSSSISIKRNCNLSTPFNFSSAGKGRYFERNKKFASKILL